MKLMCYTHLRKKDALIVEDEPNIGLALQIWLRKAGISSKIARDGEEALVAIAHTHPSMVFLDIMIPRVDGYEVCRRVRAEASNDDIYVIIITAKTGTAYREKALTLGADEYVSKPYSMINLGLYIKGIVE